MGKRTFTREFKLEAVKMVKVNRPDFRRHLAAIIWPNEGGVNEQQAIHGRVQGRGRQASG